MSPCTLEHYSYCHLKPPIKTEITIIIRLDIKNVYLHNSYYLRRRHYYRHFPNDFDRLVTPAYSSTEKKVN